MEWELLVFITLLISTLFQLIYQWFFLSRLIFYKPGSTKKGESQPVSVVICAKNEYANLKKYLPQILEQEHPDFEVVLVNDRSTDGSDKLLKKFQSQYLHLNVINLTNNVNFFKGKKLPLSIGIKSAKHENLVLTDADCYPSSPYWLKNMQKKLSNGHEIVLGYGAYEKNKGFFNSLIRYDTLTVAMNYFSFALAGLSYMGVGRNLAYNKGLFYRTGGFTSHYRINSGDDDLFINQAANNKNTTIEINPDSFTYSIPKNTFKKWFIQKKRHLSTGKYYKRKHKLLLGLFSISNFAFYASLIIVLFFTKFWLLGLMVFAIRTVGLLINYYFSAKKFNENILFLYSPIYDIIFTLFNPIILISDFLYRSNKWK